MAFRLKSYLKSLLKANTQKALQNKARTTLSVSIFAIFALALNFSAKAAPAVANEPMFEGYYKISTYGQHLGYFIVRYEFDAKKKQFKHSYYQRLSKKGTDVTESMRAVSDSEFKPISYEFTSLSGKNAKLIDVKFAKGKMTGQITEGGKTRKIALDVPAGTFLSSSLYYVMLKSPSGMKPGGSFTFKAIAEDLAEIKEGKTAIAAKMVTYGKQNAYKAVNDFAGSRYENFMTEKGEVLAAYTPATGISADLTPTVEEATAGIPLSTEMLKKVFGSVPTGISNKLMEGGLKKLPDSTPEQTIPSKTLPSKANQGVIEKTTQAAPAPKAESTPAQEEK